MQNALTVIGIKWRTSEVEISKQMQDRSNVIRVASCPGIKKIYSTLIFVTFRYSTRAVYSGLFKILLAGFDPNHRLQNLLIG